MADWPAHLFLAGRTQYLLLSSTKSLPPQSLTLAAAAIAGGALGSYLGSRRLSPLWIKRVLAVVLAIAGTKLVLGR